MRDGSTHRRHTTLSPPNWDRTMLQLARLRDHDRFEDVRALALRARGLSWSRGLLETLLDELHVSDDFDALVGRLAHLPASQYPRLVGIALLVRHSWGPEDLERTARRLGLLPVTSRPSRNHTRVRRLRAAYQRRTTC